MIQIDTIIRTCYACPSQWDAKTDDNRSVYIRYRWGNLTVHLGNPGDDSEFAAFDGECIFAQGLGDSYDGMLEYKDLKLVLEGNGIAKLPHESGGMKEAQGENTGEPTYEEAQEVFRKASDNLNQLIADGTVQVVDTATVPPDATVVTKDKESKESLERHGNEVLDELPGMDADG